MRILFVSNFYPPAHLGGMELRLKETVERLAQKGHECLVLTSDFSPEGAALQPQENVLRILPLEANVHAYDPVDHLLRYPQRLKAAQTALQQKLLAFSPDLVFFWGMWNFSPALVRAAQEILPDNVVNSFAGYWPIEPDVHELYWKACSRSWRGQLYRKALGSIALSRRYRPITWPQISFKHAIFCSDFVRQQFEEAGVHIPHARVIFSGIDTSAFKPADDSGEAANTKLRLLFAGGLMPHKGAHTVVEAMCRLKELGSADYTLTIVGRGQQAYISALEAQIREGALGNNVRIVPAVPREDMPRLMQESDIVLLATLTDEPLSRVVMEGMSSGKVVIASDTGGTPEMIRAGVDGWLFKAGDSSGLAARLEKVRGDAALRKEMGQKARQTAVERFDLSRMIDEIEEFLGTVLEEETE